jgi:hypothetical protein
MSCSPARSTSIALALTAVACATPRTTAATAASAPFDPSRSDAAALAVADAATSALGGHDRWAALEELRFELRYRNDGALEGWFQQRWDRWNGRHQFVMADPTTLSGDAAQVAWLEVRYDIFNADKLPFGRYKGDVIDDEATRRYVEVARQRFADTELLTLIYRLRDPGAHVADRGETNELAGANDLCKPSCHTVAVTFDPGTGSGTWLIDYNSRSHRPQLIEKEVDGGRVAYRIDGWTEAGGLAWPTTLTNVALPGERYEFSRVAVGTPKDEYYDPPRDTADRARVDKREGPFLPSATVGTDLERPKQPDVLAPVPPPPH